MGKAVFTPLLEGEGGVGEQGGVNTRISSDNHKVSFCWENVKLCGKLICRIFRYSLVLTGLGLYFNGVAL